MSTPPNSTTPTEEHNPMDQNFEPPNPEPSSPEPSNPEPSSPEPSNHEETGSQSRVEAPSAAFEQLRLYGENESRESVTLDEPNANQEEIQTPSVRPANEYAHVLLVEIVRALKKAKKPDDDESNASFPEKSEDKDLDAAEKPDDDESNATLPEKSEDNDSDAAEESNGDTPDATLPEKSKGNAPHEGKTQQESIESPTSRNAASLTQEGLVESEVNPQGEKVLQLLIWLGHSREQALRAIGETDGTVQQALDWLKANGEAREI